MATRAAHLPDSGQPLAYPQQVTDNSRQQRPLVTIVMIAVAALLLGLVVFTVLREGVELLWGDLPPALPEPLFWVFIVAMPALAGALVGIIRSRGGAGGHSPLQGFSFAPVTLRDYPWLLGAVAVTLFGGLVVGPEVALVTTGSMVGTEIARRRGDIEVKKAVTIGIGFGILALFIGPIFAGSFDLSPRYTFAFSDLVGAVLVALITAAVLTVGRVAAIRIVAWRGGDLAKPGVMAALGALVGLLALGYVLISDEPVILVLTSGEGQIKELAALASVGAIALATLVKFVAYTVSMGSGFRGGPFFPAIFVGAGIGLIGELAIPEWATGASAAGMVAAFSYLAHAKLPATVVLGAVLGLLTGGLPIIVLTIVAALVARAAPKVLITTDETTPAAVGWQR